MTTTITVTIPNPKKSGNVLYFTIEFLTANFDKVIDLISEVKTIEQLNNSVVWKVK
jgi:hypothetical protein